MTRSYPIYNVCLICGNLIGDEGEGEVARHISKKDLAKYIFRLEENNFYSYERDENETDEKYYFQRIGIKLLIPGASANIFRCIKCNFVFFHMKYKLSHELKRRVLSGEIFEEFISIGLSNTHNWEIMSKILIIEKYPPSVIAKAYLYTLEYCNYDNIRREYITNQLEKYLLKMTSEKEKEFNIDESVSNAILGEAYRRVRLFDKSIEYFSNVKTDFPRNIVKRQLQLSIQKDSSISVRIHPLDSLRKKLRINT